MGLPARQYLKLVYNTYATERLHMRSPAYGYATNCMLTKLWLAKQYNKHNNFEVRNFAEIKVGKKPEQKGSGLRKICELTQKCVKEGLHKFSVPLQKADYKDILTTGWILSP